MRLYTLLKNILNAIKDLNTATTGTATATSVVTAGTCTWRKVGNTVFVNISGVVFSGAQVSGATAFTGLPLATEKTQAVCSGANRTETTTMIGDCFFMNASTNAINYQASSAGYSLRHYCCFSYPTK